MRTTLDIDDDVLLAAKESARRGKTSLGAVISDLVRRSLLQADQGAEPGKSPLNALGIRPLPKRGGVLSNEMINQLRDDGVY